MPEEPERQAPIESTRQVTIDALCEHFANDVIVVEEFERRVDLAHSATSSEALKELLRDLPGGNLPAALGPTGLPTRNSPAHLALRKERGFVLAVMGGSSRKGRWVPAGSTHAVAIMGGVELDFRDALLGPGVTELHVYAIWGGVNIIVPPGLQVESRGLALLGGFDHAADGLAANDPDAPTLIITGVALMGGVDITVRHPGESDRDARQRRRVERRERRRLGPGAGG